jgi:uncharacterized protein (TIGR02246 family)
MPSLDTAPDQRTTTPASGSGTGAATAEDVAAARALVAAYEDAWNRHDMRALGALFADDAEWVNIVGMWWRDRAALTEAHAAYHATMFKDTPTRLDVGSVRALAPDVLVAVCTVTMGDFTTPDGRVMKDSRDRLSLVLVRRAAGWRIGHGHNTVIDPVAAPFDPVNR